MKREFYTWDETKNELGLSHDLDLIKRIPEGLQPYDKFGRKLKFPEEYHKVNWLKKHKLGPLRRIIEKTEDIISTLNYPAPKDRTNIIFLHVDYRNGLNGLPGFEKDVVSLRDVDKLQLYKQQIHAKEIEIDDKIQSISQNDPCKNYYQNLVIPDNGYELTELIEYFTKKDPVSLGNTVFFKIEDIERLEKENLGRPQTQDRDKGESQLTGPSDLLTPPGGEEVPAKQKSADKGGRPQGTLRQVVEAEYPHLEQGRTHKTDADSFAKHLVWLLGEEGNKNKGIAKRASFAHERIKSVSGKGAMLKVVTEERHEQQSNGNTKIVKSKIYTRKCLQDVIRAVHKKAQ